jgi:hypothetical protein
MDASRSGREQHPNERSPTAAKLIGGAALVAAALTVAPHVPRRLTDLVRLRQRVMTVWLVLVAARACPA